MKINKRSQRVQNYQRKNRKKERKKDISKNERNNGKIKEGLEGSTERPEGGFWKEGQLEVMLVVERWVGLSLPALWLSAPVGQAFLPHSPVPGAAGTGTPLPLCGGAVWPPSEAYRSPTEEGHHGGKGGKKHGKIRQKVRLRSRVQGCDLTCHLPALAGRGTGVHADFKKGWFLSNWIHLQLQWCVVRYCTQRETDVLHVLPVSACWAESEGVVWTGSAGQREHCSPSWLDS